MFKNVSKELIFPVKQRVFRPCVIHHFPEGYFDMLFHLRHCLFSTIRFLINFKNESNLKWFYNLWSKKMCPCAIQTCTWSSVWKNSCHQISRIAKISYLGTNEHSISELWQTAWLIKDFGFCLERNKDNNSFPKPKWYVEEFRTGHNTSLWRNKANSIIIKL